MGDSLGKTFWISTAGSVIFNAAYFWYSITRWKETENLLMKGASAPNCVLGICKGDVIIQISVHTPVNESRYDQGWEGHGS